MNVRELLHNIWLFFIDTNDNNCRVCGRPEYLDCIDDELCGRAERYYRDQHGDPGELLREIVESCHLSDVRGDASGGHLLSEARSFLKRKKVPYKV